MSEQADAAGDGYGGRPPTSHERRSGQQWDDSYRERSAPWDIGRPQAAVARLVDEAAFIAPVLDAGCGTGENALVVAEAGLQVVGVDVAQTALSMARDKAAARGVGAEFVLADAFLLASLDRMFETVLDCGLFHTFDADERERYVESLASVTAAGGTLFLLCFSDAEPGDWGPHRITRQDLETAFSPARGWRISSLAADRIETTFDDVGAAAWLARIERL